MSSNIWLEGDIDLEIVDDEVVTDVDDTKVLTVVKMQEDVGSEETVGRTLSELHGQDE